MRVVGHELGRLSQLGGLHQLTVDAYGAQHAGPRVPAIGVAFGLIGLHLALDQGWTAPARVIVLPASCLQSIDALA